MLAADNTNCRSLDNGTVGHIFFEQSDQCAIICNLYQQIAVATSLNAFNKNSSGDEIART